MADDLVVVGAGGFGREAVDVAEAMRLVDGRQAWNLLGVADDNPSALNLERLRDRGLAYLGTTSELLASAPRGVYVVGIGSPTVRRDIASRFDARGWEAAVLVHPASTLGTRVSLGPGTVICAGARLTTNIRLGGHVHVNPNVTIGHDTTLGDFVSLNPSASISGDCLIGDCVLVGVQGVVLNQVSVAAGSVIGASACLTRSLENPQVVKGVPAR